MSELREKVARIICGTHMADMNPGGQVDPEALENEWYDWTPEADAAIAAVLDALKNPGASAIRAGMECEEMGGDGGQIYLAMLTAFTRAHYLSAMAEEDGKEL